MISKGEHAHNYFDQCHLFYVETVPPLKREIDFSIELMNDKLTVGFYYCYSSSSLS